MPQACLDERAAQSGRECYCGKIGIVQLETIEGKQHMSAALPEASWFEHFFSGAALDLWRSAIPEERTNQEVQFLREVLGASEGSRLLDLPCGNGRLSVPLSLSYGLQNHGGGFLCRIYR